MRFAFAAVLFATLAGCQSSAYADRGYHPEIAIDVAPQKERAPYDVQVVREDGDVLPTYGLKDRFYVEGAAGERYTIRVSNPTNRRVEAVISVDGLDAVDGDPGDLRKRGYIVPPYGQVAVEGFRTSLDDVATFRFSSVGESYAATKGKARNVGVIAVAIFEEAGPPPEPAQQIGGNYDYRGDIDEDDDAAESAPATHNHSAKKAPPPPPAPAAAAPTTTGASSGRADKAVAEKDDDGGEDRARSVNRPGLGTQFGEQRSSSATYTQFIRSTQRPVAVAELRYNDAAGLIALGVPLQAQPDQYELMERETANPFPGDHFAQPPR
ncbi:MAG TPA: hypothetical protein VGG28_32345 [Kofleriaceae bacterium]